MEGTVQIRIDKEDLEHLPSGPAVYALFTPGSQEDEKVICRYVGATTDLVSALEKHFKLTEPNIGLRYFLFSNKPKILKFSMTGMISDQRLMTLQQEWIRQHHPDLNLFDRELVLS
jgi:hypothetical protein